MTVFATDKKNILKLPKMFTALVTFFEVILVILLSYYASLIIKGTLSETAIIKTNIASSSQTEITNSKDVFSNLTTIDAFFSAEQNRNAQFLVMAPESNLDLKIFGLRTSSNGKGTAILKQQGDVQKLYQVGQNISDTVRLTSVYQDRIEISRNGITETIYLDKERSTQSIQSNRSTSAKENDQALNDQAIHDQKIEKIEKVIAALDLNPFRKNNRINGFVIGAEAEAILLAQVGLEAGDILYEVNGEELISWERIEEISESSNDDGLNIKFERHGEIQTKTISNLILGL